MRSCVYCGTDNVCTCREEALVNAIKVMLYTVEYYRRIGTGHSYFAARARQDIKPQAARVRMLRGI